MYQLHNEILTENQKRLLPVFQKFTDDFGLVGGTAIALHLGHRESIDFDLFTKDTSFDFNVRKIRQRFERVAKISLVVVDTEPEFTFKCGDVKVTFYEFPYAIPYTVPIDDVLYMPDLLTLAAMKCFAIGQRAKWKDYVDIYFILQKHDLNDVARRAKELFAGHFNEKLLREQLSYFDDIDYREQVVFKPGFEVGDEEIKATLVKASLEK